MCAPTTFVGDKVKNEGAKRAAADAIEDKSGDVQVTSKPPQETGTFSRPAKRGKGLAGEDDVEMVGMNGVELPHNRFNCPEVRVLRDRSGSPHLRQIIYRSLPLDYLDF